MGEDGPAPPEGRRLGPVLAALRPVLHPGGYVFAVLRDGRLPVGLRPVVTVAEDEGLTVVVSREQADRPGLAYDDVAGWITLTVRSALDLVGLTVAVSGRLARAGLSCNMVAGYHHDHVFVPLMEAPRALQVLRLLAAAAQATAD